MIITYNHSSTLLSIRLLQFVMLVVAGTQAMSISMSYRDAWYTGKADQNENKYIQAFIITSGHNVISFYTACGTPICNLHILVIQVYIKPCQNYHFCSNYININILKCKLKMFQMKNGAVHIPYLITVIELMYHMVFLKKIWLKPPYLIYFK